MELFSSQLRLFGASGFNNLEVIDETRARCQQVIIKGRLLTLTAS
jgi:hypothetical protein